MTHVTDDERYAWLNVVVCGVAGVVEPGAAGAQIEVVLDVSQLVWEPLGDYAVAKRLSVSSGRTPARCSRKMR